MTQKRPEFDFPNELELEEIPINDQLSKEDIIKFEILRELLLQKLYNIEKLLEKIERPN